MAERHRPKLPPLSIPKTTTNTWFPEIPLPLRSRAEIADTTTVSPQPETHLIAPSPPTQRDHSSRPLYPPPAYDRYCDYAPELASFQPSGFLEDIEEEVAESASERVTEHESQEEGKYPSTTLTPDNTSPSEPRMTIMTGRLNPQTTFLAAWRWSWSGSGSGPASLRSGVPSARDGRSESAYSQDETGHLAPPPDRRNTLQPASPFNQLEAEPPSRAPARRNTILLPLSRFPFDDAYVCPRTAPHPNYAGPPPPDRTLAVRNATPPPPPFYRVFEPDLVSRLLDRVHTTRTERRRQQLTQVLAIVALLCGIAMVSAAIVLAWEARGRARKVVVMKGGHMNQGK